MVALLLALFACGPAEETDETAVDTRGCDNGVEVGSYLMTFNSCLTPGCQPQQHTVHLATSDDGLQWSLIDVLGEDHTGSVPDIAWWNGSLYIFHTGAGGEHMWDRLNSCLQIEEQGTVSVLGGSQEDEGWVDPSLIVDGEDLLLYYLPGVMGGDPAACPEGEDTCVKEIRSIKTDAGAFPDFTLVAGARVEATVGAPPEQLGGFSDPDILHLIDDSYLLNVSSGSNALAYVGLDLGGSFSIPGGGSDPLFVSQQQGGVPSAIQEQDSGDVWLYVHQHSDNGITIRRAVSSGVVELDSSDFQNVLDRSVFPTGALASGEGVFSPSVIHWP